jgi:hypothetical protein
LRPLERLGRPAVDEPVDAPPASGYPAVEPVAGGRDRRPLGPRVGRPLQVPGPYPGGVDQCRPSDLYVADDLAGPEDGGGIVRKRRPGLRAPPDGPAESLQFGVDDRRPCGVVAAVVPLPLERV